MGTDTGPVDLQPPMGHCPQCRRPSSLSRGNPWRPFCCERCKLIDLGDWMSGRFAIAVEPGEGDGELPPDVQPRQ